MVEKKHSFAQFCNLSAAQRARPRAGPSRRPITPASGRKSATARQLIHVRSISSFCFAPECHMITVISALEFLRILSFSLKYCNLRIALLPGCAQLPPAPRALPWIQEADLTQTTSATLSDDASSDASTDEDAAGSSARSSKSAFEVPKRGRLMYVGGQTLEGSFSAVSKPNFASKYALELAICSKRRLRKGTWGETEK